MSHIPFVLDDCQPGRHVPSEIRQSTRSKHVPTKNVCKECARLIVLDGNVWVIDQARERELDGFLRMSSGI